MQINGVIAPTVGQLWVVKDSNKRTGIYEILQIAQHAATGEYFVIYKYKGADKNVISWARPITSFVDMYMEYSVSTRESGLQG